MSEETIRELLASDQTRNRVLEMRQYFGSSSDEDYEDPPIAMGEEEKPVQDIPIKNYDDFFTKAYDYHTARGIKCLILYTIKSICMYALVGFVTFFVMNFIDYRKWLSALDDSPVLYFTDYISISFHSINIVSIVILPFYLSSLIVYVTYKLYTLQKYMYVREFYQIVLRISDSDLGEYTWEQIAMMIGEKFDGRHDPLSIAQRIMRKDNYLIGLVTQNIIKPPLFTQITEWVISITLKRTLFFKSWGNTQELSVIYRDTPQFADNVKRLKGYMFMYGIVSIMLLPFIGVGMFAYYVYRYTLQTQSSARPSLNLFSKEWNWNSKWHFREINELDHLFNKRLALSYNPAEKYSSQFPRNDIAIVSQLFIFLCGMILSIMLLYGLVLSDELLWKTVFLGHSLILYASILTIAMGFAYKLIPEKYLIFSPQEHMDIIVENLKYVPIEWKSHASSRGVYSQFSKFYEFKWYIALKEFASIFLIPYVLIVYLPKNMDAILDFYVKNSVQSPKSGYIYSGSAFSLEDCLVEDNYVQTRTTASCRSFMDANASYIFSEDP